jgi:TonB-linked SusC/RagA family outer membrane protein
MYLKTKLIYSMKKIVQKIGLLLLVCMFGVAQIQARTHEDVATSKTVNGEKAVASPIKGKITAENGDPLVGASIVVKGTTNGTITDIDGNYSLSVADPKAILVVSFVGFDAQEIALNGQTELNITLKESGALSEVVVIGYGTQKKSQTTGAISSLNARQLTEMPVTNVAQALQGRVAGVDVVQSGSKPGSVPTIRVRGRRSFRASNDPLYVVDGVPLAGTPATPENLGISSTGGSSGYEDLNPNDVQSIEVLKDATSTAIYGSRGANGVVLITTKRGALGANGKRKTTVSYDNYFGQSQVLNKLNLFSGTEFAEYVRESRRGVAAGSIYKDINGVPVPSGVKDDFADSKVDVFDPIVLAGIKAGRNTQYQDLMLRQGSMQNHSIGVQGGDERTAFYISGSYFNDQGVSPGLDYSRMSIRANIDHQINDRFKVGISSFGMLSTRNGANWNPYGFALNQNPLGSLYNPVTIKNPTTNIFEVQKDANGIPIDDVTNPIFSQTNDALLTNPLYEIIPGAQIDEQKRYRILNALYLEAKIMDGLTYRVNFGPDFTVQRGGRFIGSLTNRNKGGNNLGQVDNRFSFDYTLENILNYNKAVGKHNVGVTALHSIQKDNFEQYVAQAQGIPVEKQSFYNLGNASLVLAPVSNLIQWTINSFMGRINYDYDNKYLLTATIRRDGSSRFGENVKYGNFPGIALGWNISNEDFMKGTNKWLDNLKLRLSWGSVGNQAVSPYQTQGLLSRTVYAFGTTGAFGYRPNTIGNNDLQWESSTTKNLGLDFTLLNGRVYGSFELYRVNTTSLLLADQLPTSIGFPSVTKNVGETQNQGVELTLSTVNVDRGGFKWTTDFAFTKNNEQIISLYNGAVDDIGNKWFIGKPLTAMFDYTKVGIWQTNEADAAKALGSRVGQIHLTDLNGDGKINADDRSYIGSEIPKWTGSFTSRFSFKGFDASIIVYARMGQMLFSGFHYNVNQLAGRYQQIKVDYWTPNNPTNEFPQPNKDQEFPVGREAISYFDGSFVKIRNINFGYTLPSALTKKLGIESLRLFSSIQQPKIWATYISKYNGVDPEVSEGASTGNGITPATTVTTIGLNVKF